MPIKTPQFVATKPSETGHPIGGGYQCTVCGLTELTNQEPHISSVGRVCYPAPPGQAILVKGGPKGEIIRAAVPAPETVEDIHKEIEPLRVSIEARIKAAQAREDAALEAKKLAEAEELKAATELAAAEAAKV